MAALLLFPPASRRSGFRALPLLLLAVRGGGGGSGSSSSSSSSRRRNSSTSLPCVLSRRFFLVPPPPRCALAPSHVRRARTRAAHGHTYAHTCACASGSPSFFPPNLFAPARRALSSTSKQPNKQPNPPRDDSDDSDDSGGADSAAPSSEREVGGGGGGDDAGDEGSEAEKKKEVKEQEQEQDEKKKKEKEKEKDKDKDKEKEKDKEKDKAKEKEKEKEKERTASAAGGGGGEKRRGAFDFDFSGPLRWALLWGLPLGVFTSVVVSRLSRGDSTSSRGRETDWNHFVSTLLPSGNISAIDIYHDSNLVYVFAAPEMPSSDRQAAGAAGAGWPQYHLVVLDTARFEERLIAAQDDLGISPVDRIPVRHRPEVASRVLKLLWSGAPTLVLIGVMVYATVKLRSQMGGSGGVGGLFSQMQRQITRVKNVKTTFADVAGVEEAKVEVMEFVDFLKNPKKYRALGAKIPRGVLLVGPPGTGKTLLARATAGEAAVPFYSVTGSDFVEMFVGVGPSRVRELFKEARKNSPCIVFLDEIDAIGRARSKSAYANDERENTLNQLLVEMDGFETDAGVVVMAGTNRPDVLDNALTRPGRFDRQIQLDLPSIRGREQIFRVHLKGLKLCEPVEAFSKPLATHTAGFSGADIANVCNEGALIAARERCDHVELRHFEAALERVVGGLERKTRLLSPPERRTVAYHESGHALVGWFLKHADPILKVSIIPRGVGALGYAMYVQQDVHLQSAAQLLDQMCMMLGGRVAEEVHCNQLSTGARDDLQRVTRLAYEQVTKFGMSGMGAVAFPPPRDGELERPYSQETGKAIDSEARRIVLAAYSRTRELVEEKRGVLAEVAELLLEKEVLGYEDIAHIFGPRPEGANQKFSFDEIVGGAADGTGSSDSTSPAPATPAAPADAPAAETVMFV